MAYIFKMLFLKIIDGSVNRCYCLSCS